MWLRHALRSISPRSSVFSAPLQLALLYEHLECVVYKRSFFITDDMDMDCSLLAVAQLFGIRASYKPQAASQVFPLIIGFCRHLEHVLADDMYACFLAVSELFGITGSCTRCHVPMILECQVNIQLEVEYS